ncbi:MAG: thiamine phosphate synthase [Acidobacteria bacterium]|nr:MAG: thiamine phosphate synthase [Acidobacteriota bacterium]
MTLPPLYVIVDADLAAARGWNVHALARAYLEGGARLLQVRAKSVGGAEYLALCDEVLSAARAVGATVIVNDRADVAAMAGADGVHVGQEDLAPREVRAAFPGIRLVGLSTHTPAQIDAAAPQSIDYLAVGPVFPTGTKDTGYGEVGLELVRHARQVVAAGAGGGEPRPVVAIGGITLERAPAVLEAGATSVAVISDLLATGDPATRVQAYLAALTR